MQLKGEANLAEPGAELFYAATLLPLKSHRYIPAFMRLSLQIAKQVKQADGLIRFAIKTDMPRKTFYTFCVWASPEQMRDFVSQEPHRTAVARFWDWRAEGGGASAEWTEPRIGRLTGGRTLSG